MRRSLRFWSLVSVMVVCLTACTLSEADYVKAAGQGDLSTVTRGLKLQDSLLHEQAFEAALQGGHHEILHAIIKGPGIHVGIALSSLRRKLGKDLGAAAQIKMTPEVVDELLQQRTCNPQDLLWMSVMAQNTPLVRHVLEHAATKKHLATLQGPQRGNWIEVAAKASGEGDISIPIVTNQDTKTLRLLLEHGMSSGLVTLLAIREGKRDALVTILEAPKADVDETVKPLNVALLHLLSEQEAVGRVETVRLLLDRGATHERALTLAVTTKDPEVVKLFLARGSTDLDTAWLNAMKLNDKAIMALIEQARRKRDAGPRGVPSQE